MSRFLAIDLDPGFAHVAAGTARGGTSRLESAHTFSFSIAEPLTPANAAGLGRQLREALKAAGVAPAPLVAAVGRDRVILKDIKIPAVSPADEPPLVRFAALKDMTEAADTVVLDYFTLDRPDPDGQVRAVVATVRKDVLTAYQAFANAAGLKLVGLTPRPLGTAAALDRAIATGSVTAPDAKRASVALLTRGDRWGELLICRDGQPVFSRALSATALNSESMFLGELRRNLAVFNGQNPQQPVEGVYIAEAANAAAGWSGRVRAGLPVNVQAFDPLEGTPHDTAPDARGNFASLAGLLQLKGKGGPLALDFTSPRQPIVKRAIDTRLLVAAVSLLLLAVLGGLAYGYKKVGDKQKELTDLVKKKADYEKQRKEMEEDERRVATLKEWDDYRVNWLDELYDLTARVPDVKSMRLEQFRAEPIAAPKGKVVGPRMVARLYLKMSADASVFIDRFTSAMVTDKRYHQINKNLKKTSGGITSLPQERVELTVSLEKRPNGEYTRKLVAAPPSRPGRSKDVDGASTGGVGPLSGIRGGDQ